MKFIYTAPVIRIEIVVMEDSVGAASATIQSGGSSSGNPWNPQMDDFTENESNNSFFDL